MNEWRSSLNALLGLAPLGAAAYYMLDRTADIRNLRDTCLRALQHDGAMLGLLGAETLGDPLDTRTGMLLYQMMMEGILCESCGSYIDPDEEGEAEGYPRICADCAEAEEES